MAIDEHSPVVGLVLAAGKGTRMRSDLPKVLHTVAGRTMLERVFETLFASGIRKAFGVIGYRYELVLDHFRNLGDRVSWVIQHDQRGTGHAVMTARDALGKDPATLVLLSGDVPLLSQKTLREVIGAHRASAAPVTLLTTQVADPSGYGRVLRAGLAGHFAGIVEERDATPDQRAIREINTGIYCFELTALLPYLDRLRPTNVQGEYYLTDVFAMMVADGLRVHALTAGPPEEFLGINNRIELAAAEGTLYALKARMLMRAGITIHDPASTFVHDTVDVGQDTVLHPGVSLLGHTTVGGDCQIRSWTTVRDSTIGDGCVIKEGCTIEGARLGPGVTVGPMANLRPGTVLEAGVRVGNFVEVKATTLGAGTKANHLTYLGDATVGRGVNVGAGTITCNFDGQTKHPTHIGDDVFIGSDSILVAPVTVGERAYIGAGSVITRDVPASALAIARERQVNKPGYRELIERRRSAATRAQEEPDEAHADPAATGHPQRRGSP